MGERRILVVADVSPLETHGGAARVIREQSRRLAARGNDVMVLSRHPGDDQPLSGPVAGVPVLHYEVDRRRPLAFVVTSLTGARRRFRSALAEAEWDTVIFHQPFSAAALAPLVPATRRLYVFHSPAGQEYRLRAEPPGGRLTAVGTRVAAALLTRLERRALSAAAHVVVLSEFSRRVLIRSHGRLRAAVSVVPGAADLERFRPPGDRRAVRARLGFPESVVLLLTVRDLQPRMGLDTLLSAVEALRPTTGALVCVIGGSGGLRAPLERLAGDLGIADVVRFAGHIPEEALPAHYQAADLFVLPTRALEGFGLVTVEALACATPVVATRVGATPEILEPLDRRLLADNSAAGLAAALAGALPLARDAEFRRRCRAHAEARYSWDRHVDSLEQVIAGA